MSDTPQNWLTEFPLSMRPDSWDLNPIFLRKLQELQVMWDAFGYTWKFGCELEFTLAPPEKAAEEAEKNISFPGFGIVHPEYVLLKEAAERAQAAADTPNIYGYALEKIRQNFSVNPDIDKLLKDSRWTHQNALDHLNQIENNLNSEDDKIAHRARQNVFLAYIHTHNFDEGGVMDLVEARFGDYEAGLGWYDMAGPEIRTKILGTAEDTIEYYHKFLHVLSTQAARFGLALDLTFSGPPQPHISIWRKADNKNMMKMADEHSLVFCERAMSGYYELMNKAPFLIQDRDYRQLNSRVIFSAGTTREDYIREEDDNWEIRRGQFYGVTHMARHLMMVMMGMAYGCMYPRSYNEFSQHQAFLQLERSQKPVVRHRHGAYISGLASVLQHCSIGEDGYLTPHVGMIKNYLDRMQDEVGYSNLDDFTIGHDIDPKFSFNLRHSSTWEALFKKIKLTPDNNLDLSFLGQNSEVAEAFAAIEITGRRTVLNAGNDHMETEAYSTLMSLQILWESEAGTIFFTPYEQTELNRHYSKQSHAIMKDNAQYLVWAIESVRAHTENSDFSDAEIATWLLEDKLLKTSEAIDNSDTFIRLLLIYLNQKAKMDRNAYLEWGSYITAMRPYFQQAAEQRIQILESDPDKAAIISLLKLCVDRVLEKPFSLRDRILQDIEHVFNVASNGSLMNHSGLTDNFIQGLEITPKIWMLHALGLALRDNAFSEKQIVHELDSMFRAAPSKVEALERQLKIAEKDEMAQRLFGICRKGFLKSTAELRDWACETMGHGLQNQLAVPENKTGPEHMSGPA